MKTKITENMLVEAYANNVVLFKYYYWLGTKYGIIKKQTETYRIPPLHKCSGFLQVA